MYCVSENTLRVCTVQHPWTAGSAETPVGAGTVGDRSAHVSGRKSVYVTLFWQYRLRYNVPKWVRSVVRWDH